VQGDFKHTELVFISIQPADNRVGRRLIPAVFFTAVWAHRQVCREVISAIPVPDCKNGDIAPAVTFPITVPLRLTSAPMCGSASLHSKPVDFGFRDAYFSASRPMKSVSMSTKRSSPISKVLRCGVCASSLARAIPYHRVHQLSISEPKAH